MNIVFWVILAILASTTQVTCVNMFTKKKDICWIMIALLASCTLIFSYIQLLSQTNLESIYPFIKILSIVLVVLASICLFDAKPNTTMIVGLVFGFVSIYLLSSTVQSRQ